MPSFLTGLLKKAKKNQARIAFVEPYDVRILQAVSRALKEKTCIPILIGAKKKIQKIIETNKLRLDISKVIIFDPKGKKNNQVYSQKLYELRKHKNLTLRQAQQKAQYPDTFGALLLNEKVVDGLITGATMPTPQALKSIFEIIKPENPEKKASGVFILSTNDRTYLFADIAVIIAPDENEMIDIAINTANTAKKLNLTPKVGILSFSTKDPAHKELMKKYRNVINKVKSKDKTLIIDGEIQMDAAISPKTAKIKCPESPLKGNANVLIFPNLECGNIAYKTAEQFGKTTAIGALLQGLPAPVIDLSRGCSENDIFNAIVLVSALK